MNKREFLDLCTKYAKDYRGDALVSVKRNRHMNSLVGEPGFANQVFVDALLVDFINFMGRQMGVDWGLYTKDLDNVTGSALESERAAEQKLQDGGAFFVRDGDKEICRLTVLDAIAIAAMAGMLASDECTRALGELTTTAEQGRRMVAEVAYKHAFAMLAEREKARAN